MNYIIGILKALYKLDSQILYIKGYVDSFKYKLKNYFKFWWTQAGFNVYQVINILFIHISYSVF